MIAALLLASVPLGMLAWSRFKTSDRLLSAERESTRLLAPGLSAEECVERALRLRAACGALPPLCDQAVGENMDVCLRGRDRSSECAGLGDELRSTRFGFDACKSQRGSRVERTACATAYRAIASHCLALRSRP